MSTTKIPPTATESPPHILESEASGLTRRMLGWVLTIGGLLGGVAAFVLIVEKVTLLRNPGYLPSCSINPILSCGSVMTTPQAEVFGFPNPLIGVATFPVVVTTGLLVLASVQLPRWWWLGLQAGTLFGVGFVHWLFFQSVYRIGALCPYCMLVWVAAIVVFCYTTLYALHCGHLPIPARWRPGVAAVVRIHTAIPTIWLLLVAALIGEAFWSYWRTLL